MTSRLALRLALRIVAAVAPLVPASARDDWRREWDAELRHRAAQTQHRRPQTWRTTVDLIGRALGALPDAAWIRRQLTLDADAVRDAAHGARLLWRTPGFTAIALLVFAIGIGATTAMLSVADTLLVRPLAIPQPERVMTLWQFNRDTGVGRLDVAPANALDWLQRLRSFETVAYAEPWTINTVIPNREPEYLAAARVSEQFFTVLGASLRHGRVFEAQEYQRGGPRVAILGYALWRDRFGSDPALVGRSVRLDNDDAYTIVGVMPPHLELRLFRERASRQEPMVWLPKQGIADFERTARAPVGYWNVIGRLRPGVSMAQARAEMDTISTQLAREYPRTNSRISAQMLPLRAHLVGSLRDVLPLLLGAAAILLVVACANVANLLLARGAARTGEFAVRQALGANRLRLVRQMLAESLLLAIAGGGVGLLLARATLDAIARLRPGDIALLDRIPIDARAAAIACGVTLLAALIAGLAPSLQLSRPAAASALKEGRTSPRQGVRRALVVLEIAAALVLAVGAGLLARSFLLVRGIDPGFSAEHVSIVQVFSSPRTDTPEKRIAFAGQVLDRLQALPGVVAAGAVSSMPFGRAKVIVRTTMAIADRSAAAGEEPQIQAAAVSGDYFQAMGVALLKGRLIGDADTATSRHVVLVSRSAARLYWPNADPLGARVKFRFTGTAYDAEVVGIVDDVRHEALEEPAAAEIYLPYAQSGFRALTLVVRTTPESLVEIQTLKQQIWAIDPLQSIFHSDTLAQLVSKTLTERRFTLLLLGGFALATLVLAAAGVYGVMSFNTSQRTREFGVRLALGAKRRDIVRLVLTDGLKLSAVGVIVGITAALPLARMLRSLLFGVTASDPVTFVAVGLGLVAVAAAACYVPASRAIKLDPVKALRLD